VRKRSTEMENQANVPAEAEGRMLNNVSAILTSVENRRMTVKIMTEDLQEIVVENVVALTTSGECVVYDLQAW
jgi:hypothetical protein